MLLLTKKSRQDHVKRMQHEIGIGRTNGGGASHRKYTLAGASCVYTLVIEIAGPMAGFLTRLFATCGKLKHQLYT